MLPQDYGLCKVCKGVQIKTSQAAFSCAHISATIIIGGRQENLIFSIISEQDLSKTKFAL